MDSLLNIFAQPAGTISIFGTRLAMPDATDGRPTADQIAAATTIVVANDLGEDSLQESSGRREDNQCSICFENYTNGQYLRRINHCEHMFHKTCIDRWFTTNVCCPNCRHNIIETNNNNEEYEYDYDENDNDDDDDNTESSIIT
jgi:hypothetical protein